MATGVHSWSTTAATNATADSNVNWAEGQAPSSVNDSARAEMASVAKYYADTNGSITTGGTSTAYTVTSNQNFASLAVMGGAVIAFVPHTTNGATPTLAVDGLTAKKIRFDTGKDIQDGVLIAGTPYTVTYYAGVGEFILHNLAGALWTCPIGSGFDYWGLTAPTGHFAFPYGQAISRTTYAVCYNIMGTTYGVGDGSSTFNLPDKRGRVSAGKDNMGGSSAARLANGVTGSVAGTTLGAVGGEEGHTLLTAGMPVHAHGITDPGHTHLSTSTSALAGTTTAGAGSGGGFTAIAGPSIALSGLSTTSSTTGITAANAGSGAAHNNVQPTIICNYILRVI